MLTQFLYNRPIYPIHRSWDAVPCPNSNSIFCNSIKGRTTTKNWNKHEERIESKLLCVYIEKLYHTKRFYLKTQYNNNRHPSLYFFLKFSFLPFASYM